jgi:hypothetical protein
MFLALVISCVLFCQIPERISSVWLVKPIKLVMNIAGADALEKFADELVQIHNLAVISKSVVYAKEAAQTLREKAKQHGKDTENWRLQCAGVRK